jgi:hypothetical protein
MKNRLDEFSEGGGVIPLHADESEAAERSWTVTARPRSKITHQEVGVMELTVVPPPTDAEKTRWGVVLLDLLDTVEGTYFFELLTDFSVVGKHGDITCESHLKDRIKVLQMSRFSGRNDPVELPFPGFFKTLRANYKLRFVSLVFQAVSERDKIVAVRDN